MTNDIHHEHLIKEITEHLKPIFEKSPQGIYLYLDDTHKTCNQKFAGMLGYASIKEWISNEYPIEDVVEEDRKKGIQAYIDASEKYISTTLPATWVSKDGKKIKTEVTMIPLSYQGEVFVLHFITPRNK